MRKTTLIVLIILLFCSIQVHAQIWSVSKRLTWNSGQSKAPAIAVDSSKIVHVVWYDGSSGNDEINYKRSTDEGTVWSALKRLSWTPVSSLDPAIAIDTNDNIHVVWCDGTVGDYEIYYKQSTDGGLNWSAQKRLTWMTGWSWMPAITVDSSNNIHIVWAEEAPTPGNTDIYYKQSTDGGATWSAPKRLTWSSKTFIHAAIAVDSGLNIHVVWANYDVSGNQDIYYKQSSDGGTTWSALKRLTWSSDYSMNPAIAIDSLNNIYISWNRGQSTTCEIYYKKSVTGGSSWAASKRMTWNSGWSEQSAIIFNPTNKILVMWHDNSVGNYELNYKGSTNGGTSWSTLQRLTWNHGDSKSPALVTSGSTVYLVWQDHTPGDYEIYYKKGTQF